VGLDALGLSNRRISRAIKFRRGDAAQTSRSSDAAGFPWHTLVFREDRGPSRVHGPRIAIWRARKPSTRPSGEGPRPTNQPVTVVRDPGRAVNGAAKREIRGEPGQSTALLLAHDRIGLSPPIDEQARAPPPTSLSGVFRLQVALRRAARAFCGWIVASKTRMWAEHAPAARFSCRPLVWRQGVS